MEWISLDTYSGWQWCHLSSFLTYCHQIVLGCNTPKIILLWMGEGEACSVLYLRKWNVLEAVTTTLVLLHYISCILRNRGSLSVYLYDWLGSNNLISSNLSNWFISYIWLTVKKELQLLIHFLQITKLHWIMKRGEGEQRSIIDPTCLHESKCLQLLATYATQSPICTLQVQGRLFCSPPSLILLSSSPLISKKNIMIIMRDH